MSKYQSYGESVGGLTKSVRPSFSQSARPSFSQSVSQPVRPSVSQSVSQLVRPSGKQSVSQPAVLQSVSLSVSQSVSQSASQSVSKSVNQSVSYSEKRAKTAEASSPAHVNDVTRRRGTTRNKFYFEGCELFLSHRKGTRHACEPHNMSPVTVFHQVQFNLLTPLPAVTGRDEPWSFFHF